MPGPARPAILQGDTAIPLLDGDVGTCLRRTAARLPDHAAVLWADGDAIGRLSYAALLRESERVAAFILQHACPGDRVVIWSRNSLDWILAEYGSALAGTVVVAWNTAWTDAECGHALALAEPRLVLAGQDVRGVDLLARAQGLSHDRLVVPLAALRGLADAAPGACLPVVRPDDLFLLQFTSGTTGRPKAAALTHAASLNAAWLRARLYDAGEDEIWLNPVPMTHVGGAITLLLGAMATGGAYVLMPRFEAGEFARLIGACGATRIGGVPTMLFRAMDHPDWRPVATVRSIGLGGAQVPVSLVRRLREAFGAPVLVTYGQSECPFATSSVASDPPEVAAGTVGRPAPHVTLRICGLEDGRQLALGEVGEIRVRTTVMMQGYYRMPDATAAAIDADGFLRTGDLGSLDEDGLVRIHGRARDVIIRGGENIYPAEVEEVLLQHPGVAQVAVVGIADERWGQQVGAVVVLRDAASTTAQALEAMAAARLAHFKVPRHWRFMAELPLTASGKVRKLELETSFGPLPP